MNQPIHSNQSQSGFTPLVIVLVVVALFAGLALFFILNQQSSRPGSDGIPSVPNTQPQTPGTVNNPSPTTVSRSDSVETITADLTGEESSASDDSDLSAIAKDLGGL